MAASPSLSLAPTPTRPLRSASDASASRPSSPSRARPRRYAGNWSNCSMVRILELSLTLLIGSTSLVFAQPASDLREIAERLDRLERENRALAGEVRQLRAELEAVRSGSQPPAPASTPGDASPSAAAGVDERLDIAERRIEENAQVKVESAQKFPLRLAGMALFNAFSNSL